MRSSILPKPHFFTFVISSVLLFFVSGLTLLLFLFSNPLVNYLQAQVHHIVEFKKTIVDIGDVHDIVLTDKNVDTSTVQHMLPEIALDFMKKETGMDFGLGTDNPFSQLLVFRTKTLDEIDLYPLESSLSEIDKVNNIYFQHSYKMEMKGQVDLWKKYLLASGVIMALITFLLLSNLLSIILYNDRKKLKTMELVGARNSYILFPYLRNFILLSLLSMVISLGLYGWLGHFTGLYDVLVFNQAKGIKIVGLLVGLWSVLVMLILAWASHRVMSYIRKPYEELM